VSDRAAACPSCDAPLDAQDPDETPAEPKRARPAPRPAKRRPPPPPRRSGGSPVATVTLVAGGVTFALGVATLLLGAAALLAQPEPGTRMSRDEMAAAVRHARTMWTVFQWTALLASSALVVSVGGTAMLVAADRLAGRRQ